MPADDTTVAIEDLPYDTAIYIEDLPYDTAETTYGDYDYTYNYCLDEKVANPSAADSLEAFANKVNCAF